MSDITRDVVNRCSTELSRADTPCLNTLPWCNKTLYFPVNEPLNLFCIINNKPAEVDYRRFREKVTLTVPFIKKDSLFRFKNKHRLDAENQLGFAYNPRVPMTQAVVIADASCARTEPLFFVDNMLWRNGNHQWEKKINLMMRLFKAGLLIQHPYNLIPTKGFGSTETCQDKIYFDTDESLQELLEKPCPGTCVAEEQVFIIHPETLKTDDEVWHVLGLNPTCKVCNLRRVIYAMTYKEFCNMSAELTQHCAHAQLDPRGFNEVVAKHCREIPRESYVLPAPLVPVLPPLPKTEDDEDLYLEPSPLYPAAWELNWGFMMGFPQTAKDPTRNHANSRHAMYLRERFTNLCGRILVLFSAMHKKMSTDRASTAWFTLSVVDVFVDALRERSRQSLPSSFFEVFTFMQMQSSKPIRLFFEWKKPKEDSPTDYEGLREFVSYLRESIKNSHGIDLTLTVYVRESTRAEVARVVVTNVNIYLDHLVSMTDKMKEQFPSLDSEPLQSGMLLAPFCTTLPPRGKTYVKPPLLPVTDTGKEFLPVKSPDDIVKCLEAWEERLVLVSQPNLTAQTIGTGKALDVTTVEAVVQTPSHVLYKKACEADNERKRKRKEEEQKDRQVKPRGT